MVFERLNAGLELTDREFDSMYSDAIQTVSAFHFTPVAVAKVAAQFLVEEAGDRVLDIGSGAGKFCIVGASCTTGHFTGAEQREQLWLLSRHLAKKLAQPEQLDFLHANITDIDFSAFDAVYLFNPFYENVLPADPIDHSVQLERHLYDRYSGYVKYALEAMPDGTRLATYFSYLDEVPECYRLISSDFEGKLKMWKKAVDYLPRRHRDTEKSP